MGVRRRKKVTEPEPKPIESKFKLVCTKRRWDTREEAEAAQDRTYKKNAARGSRRGALQTLYCTTCEGWHVGHIRPWEASMKQSKKARQKLAQKRMRQSIARRSKGIT